MPILLLLTCIQVVHQYHNRHKNLTLYQYMQHLYVANKLWKAPMICILVLCNMLGDKMTDECNVGWWMWWRGSKDDSKKEYITKTRFHWNIRISVPIEIRCIDLIHNIFTKHDITKMQNALEKKKINNKSFVNKSPIERYQRWYAMSLYREHVSHLSSK